MPRAFDVRCAPNSSLLHSCRLILNDDDDYDDNDDDVDDE